MNYKTLSMYLLIFLLSIISLVQLAIYQKHTNHIYTTTLYQSDGKTIKQTQKFTNGQITQATLYQPENKTIKQIHKIT